MLAPGDRRLLLDVLAPPEGHALDHAIGTTYTLDLLALLRVPLAATPLPWTEGDGEPLTNPYALLSALRRHADKVSLFCHAGAVKVPPPHQKLFAFLEDSIVQVVAPRGGVFHPKLWLLRFVSDDGSVAYRLAVLSRNLTFDRCWDIALVLDGPLADRKRGFTRNAPLAELVAALPDMAVRAGRPVSDDVSARVALLADEVRRVRWDDGDELAVMAFHPLGHDNRVRWPFGYLHRLMVVAPFVGAEAVEALGGWPHADATLVARHEELMKLSPSALDAFGEQVFAFDDGQGLLDAGNPVDAGTASELAGLHAKLFLGEADRRARIWVGSANATQAALGHPGMPGTNVELLVELEASRAAHGVQATRDTLLDCGLIRPFAAAAPVPADPVETLGRELERIATDIAAGALRASVDEEGPDRYRVELRVVRAITVPAGVSITARPITVALDRALHLDRDPVAAFPVLALVNVTPFIAVKLAARVDGREVEHEFVARVELENAPGGRHEAIMAELLSDEDRLFAFLLLLLAVDGADAEQALDTLQELGSGASSVGASLEGRLPLLEPMLRALDRDPLRLAEIARLLDDLASQPATARLVPEELRALWATIDAVRTT